MAFLKYAKANIIHPHLSVNRWMKTAKKKEDLKPNLIAQASEILNREFNPNDYLLSHATIVCSVTTEKVPNVKLGKVTENNRTINRLYPNYKVSQQTLKYINNNQDCWSREVLLKSYKTFVGAENYLEHVQVPELSKGKIIDAVIRDVGESLYVDILVATDRKHTELVEAIESKKITTLSMGCSIDFSICTKCGNVAQDEPEMCEHIKYERGNSFFYPDGSKGVVAEVCGHESHGDTAGVHFVEASWVEIPAFEGAVLRNLIIPKEVSQEVAEQMSKVLNEPPREWLDTGLKKKAEKISEDFSFMGDSDDSSEESEKEEKKEEKAPFSEVEEEVYKEILTRVKTRLKKELKQEKELTPEDSTVDLNDNLIKQAYISGVQALMKVAKNDAQFFDILCTFNEKKGIHIPKHLYQIALVGKTKKASSLSLEEKTILTKLSKLRNAFKATKER